MSQTGRGNFQRYHVIFLREMGTRIPESVGITEFPRCLRREKKLTRIEFWLIFQKDADKPRGRAVSDKWQLENIFLSYCSYLYFRIFCLFRSPKKIRQSVFAVLYYPHKQFFSYKAPYEYCLEILFSILKLPSGVFKHAI